MRDQISPLVLLASTRSSEQRDPDYLNISRYNFLINLHKYIEIKDIIILHQLNIQSNDPIKGNLVYYTEVSLCTLSLSLFWNRNLIENSFVGGRGRGEEETIRMLIIRNCM